MDRAKKYVRLKPVAVRVCKRLSGMFLIKNVLKQDDAISQFLLNLALVYAIGTVQVIQDGLKLNGTHQLLVYADDVNILGRSIHTIKKDTGALVVASMETGLEVNAVKTKYMVMCRGQNAGWSHRINIDNSSFEREEHFRYLRTTLTNQNFIQEAIKSRSKSGNTCFYSPQNLLSSILLSESVKIEINISVILHVFYGFETWWLTLKEERRLRVFENRVLRRIFGPKRDEVTGE